MARQCIEEGCTRYAGWNYHDYDFGYDVDACAEHAGYEDWEEMQAEYDPVFAASISGNEVASEGG